MSDKIEQSIGTHEVVYDPTNGELRLYNRHIGVRLVAAEVVQLRELLMRIEHERRVPESRAKEPEP
jgi:hypothetical protein